MTSYDSGCQKTSDNRMRRTTCAKVGTYYLYVNLFYLLSENYILVGLLLSVLIGVNLGSNLPLFPE